MKKITIAPQSHGSTTTKSIRAQHFFNSAFKTFSLHDNVRSIPGIDGLKPSQRKALYGTMLKGENAEPHVVARLAASVAELTDYHHGTGSMESTIAGMATVKAPGSNNMNLFTGKGQFPSRLTPDAGAGRYIKASLGPYFRQLMRKEDDVILEHILVDGEKIEPKVYLPILPLVLINGASGIGTGHSVEIKSYHPEQVRDACVRVLEGKRLEAGKLTPWFKGFHGTVNRNEHGQVVTTGKLEVLNSTTILITELPVGWYLDKYKELLNELTEPRKNKGGDTLRDREGNVRFPAMIKDFDDASVEEGFHFKITAPRSTTALPLEQLYQIFKLVARDSENFTLWNSDGVLQRFDSAEAVIEMYVPWRLKYYEVRRQKQITDTKESIRYQSEVLRFILYYLSNTEVFSGTRKKELIEILINEKFTDYDRLLSMQIWSLTMEKIEELEKKLEELKAYLAKLEAETADRMYANELKQFKYVETL